EEEGVRIIGPVDAPAPAPGPDPAPAFLEAETLEEEPPMPAPALDEPPIRPAPPAPPVSVSSIAPDPDAQPPDDEAGSVEDLFARLRAERQVSVTKAEEVLAAAPAGEAAPAGSEAPVVESGDEPREAAGADALLLERRDECVEPVATDLVRRLKRVLQDEQNEILDRLRKGRGRNRPEDALPSAADQAGRYRDAATDPLAAAARGGAAFSSTDAAPDVPARQWAQALADELVGGLRDRIERSLAAEGDADDSDGAESLGAAYRQWKTERIDQIARHHVAAAFNQGVLAAGPAGAAFRWVFGDHGPCPDCDDNALAGPTPNGESYPTGQAHPPAHVGCGCLLVIVDG
ncbi:MAG: DivIVA domain, partial [Acidimicrobiales bacterium]|nr:DivIVA domain [Acidimicrobiales bacterium]